MEITDAIVRLKEAVTPILNGGLTAGSIWRALTTLIQEAEIIYGAGKGQEKHELVRAVWKDLDERYKIVDTLDAAIPAPWYMEPFDGKIIAFSIDMIISIIVTVLNMTIWKKE